MSYFPLKIKTVLGLLLIYFIGKAFYTLAQKNQRHKWLWAVLGVLSYYVGTFVFGILAFVVSDILLWDIEALPDFAVNLMSLPFGILSCWLFHRALERQWTKVVTSGSEELLDNF